MERIVKVMLTVLLLVGLLVPLLGCGSDSAENEAAQYQTTTVQRGDLTIDIPATGNLALSHTEDLAFNIPATFTKVLTVEEVLVKVGDSVKEGQELAKLDTSAWDKQVKALEKALVKAQRDLSTQESDLADAERRVAAFELAVSKAQLDLQTAENNLKKTADLKAEYDAVDTTKFELRVAIATGNWKNELYLRERLVQAREDLQAALDKYSGTVASSDDAALKTAQSVLSLTQSRVDLEDAQIAVEDAKTAVADAQLDKQDAEQVVADAQSTLDEAKSLSPIIEAPFDGFITNVNVAGGDEVYKGKVAVTLADPTKFETEIMVSEMDIFNVKLGQSATVQVNAMPTINLSANVTNISPTATIQQGVVNYKVKVEIKSPEAIMQEFQAARQAARQTATENTTQASGRQAATGNTTQASGRQAATGNTTQALGRQAPTTQGQRLSSVSGNQTLAFLTSQIAQLKQGLTVTVSIVVDQRSGVLLVPNRAISRSGGDTLVKVLKDGGVTESRSIKTGVSNGVNTEVTEGLSEGEKVVIPQTTTTTTTTSTQGGGGFLIPGIGGR